MRFFVIFFLLSTLCMGADEEPILGSPYKWAQSSQEDIQKVSKIMEQTIPKKFRDKVNFVCSFIIDNSKFSTSPESNFAYYFDRPNESLSAILEHHADKNSPQPCLECYARTRLIMGILDNIGIKTRRIILFSDRDKGGTLTSHTLFEVQNPETQKWEVYDSNRNTYYVKENSDQVISMEELLFADLDRIIPCQKSQKYSWGFFPGLKEDVGQYGVILYDHFNEQKPNHIVINKHNFDVQKKFKVGHYFHSARDETPATFLQILKDWWNTYGPPIVEER